MTLRGLDMSNLRVRQIHKRIRSLFESHIDLRGISENDRERDIKILGRCLAALAIFKVTGCSEVEAGKAVWDGSGDNGIDAIFYDEYEQQLTIVQSKWIQSGKGEPSAKDISVFADGVKDIIENEVDNFSDQIRSRVENIGEAINRPGTTIHLVLISTGSSSIAEPGTKKIRRIIDELNGQDMMDEGVATFEIMGLQEIFSALSNPENMEKVKLEATVLDWTFVPQPYPAYFGVVDGYQIKSWWDFYGRRLVSKNIRDSLGQTDVNMQIRATALNEPENFWYFNNGITLIADEAIRAPASASSRASGIFELRGASIVNGAQTVSTLAKVDNVDNLGRVRVPIRIILLRTAPQNFGNDVTRTNNLQNRVEGRDFVSEDKEQSRIRNEMEIEGIEYQYKRSEGFYPSETSCDLIEVTTALACASADISYSVAVKTGIGRFFLDLSRPPYKAIFNASLTGTKAFNSVRILRAVDNWIDVKKKSIPKKSGYGWGVLVHGNRALAASVFQKYGISHLETTIGEFPAGYESTVNALCDSIHSSMVEFLERKYPGRFLAVFFKSPAKCKEVYESVARKAFH